ncbi:MAG: type VI secretion protein IcmF/TssM N-terminal domain-containing protein [Campylobacterota bacterium]|nr:type VI secretion protein IcmF/TssM N-terminal domain-containing protein [Campylobacterota bacterium]
MFKKIAIGFVFLLLFIALVFGVWYLTTINNWPLWVGASVLVGILGIILGIVFLRRYFLRRNERKFVKRVIAQEGEAIFATQEDDVVLISSLEQQWEKSIKTLYGSKLKNGGNPIYALPWVLVIGESGSGKTSLIKNSRLSSAVTDIEESAQYSGTKNCDWWFFEDAIILDTAGRYSVPIDDRRDNAEWERFLSLLTKYRKKEPINGIVVTISAERLLENDKDLIQSDALSIRKRINQLMVSIGAKFPVYLMVTKMDHIYGFTNFCDTLPDEHQSQAMGYMNESLSEHWDEVVQNGIDFIKLKIKSLQLFIIQEESQEVKELLLFSKEFDQLTPALKDFSQIVFGNNPYQKIPMLRGIYFSSAMTDGQDSSKFLSDFNLSQTPSVPQNRAYFISDFFSIILPNDRNIFTPIKEYLSWQKRNYKIAIFAWLLIFASIVGMYTYSYIQNITVIEDINYVENRNDDFEKANLTSRIMFIDKLRLDIIKIDKLNKNTYLPILSFKQSKKAEKNLKALFLKNFNDYLLQTFAFKMHRSIDKIDNNTDSQEVVSYIGFIIDSIAILKQVLDDKNTIKISPHFHTFSEQILFREESQIEPSVAFLFTNSYIAFLEWNADKDLIKEHVEVLQNQLAFIVDKKRKNLYWLTDEGVSLTRSVHIGDFWQGVDEVLAKDSPNISGSLTEKGRKNLVKNIEVLLSMMKDPSELKDNLKLFWQWYDERFYYRWKNFALTFGNGENFLKSNSKDQGTLYAMTSEENPYFNLIKTMAKEFKAYKPISKSPPWTELVIELDEVLSIAENIRHSKDSLLSKVGSEKDSILASAEKKVDKGRYIAQIKSATILNSYIDDLAKLSIVVDKKKSQLLISDFFSDSADQKAPSPSYAECHNHFKQFKHSNPYYANSDFIYDLIAGPKDYIIDYSITQMNAVLNTQWETMVLGSLPHTSNKNLLMSLFDEKKGLVWQFVHEQLDPFVTLNQYGYNIKIVEGYKLDIRAEFLRYINSGINLLSIYKSKYSFDITTLPFDTNSDAKMEANYVNLHLRCSKDNYILQNNNYKRTIAFTWSPSICGDTILTFGFNDFEVTKTYRGQNGFLHFLKDFKDGTQTFSQEDFDSSVPELKQQNIKWIRLSYNISNEGKILKLLDKTPYNVPKKVTGTK